MNAPAPAASAASLEPSAVAEGDKVKLVIGEHSGLLTVEEALDFAGLLMRGRDNHVSVEGSPEVALDRLASISLAADLTVAAKSAYVEDRDLRLRDASDAFWRAMDRIRSRSSCCGD